MSHTKEPWKVDGADIWHVGEGYGDRQDPHLFTGITLNKHCQTPRAFSNLQRTVDCVNALTGVPPGKEQEAMDKVRAVVLQFHTLAKQYPNSAASGQWIELAALLGIGGEK